MSEPDPRQPDLDLNLPASPTRCSRCGRRIPAGRWVQIRTGTYACLPCALAIARERKAGKAEERTP
jgi:hypothetical protein